MIAFFPDPVKGQLLADVFGRFRILNGSQSRYSVNRDLFDRETISTNIDFPSALECLIRNLPREYQYTALYFIYYHTIVPYYGPFVPPDKVGEITTLMLEDSGEQISPRIGIP